MHKQNAYGLRALDNHNINLASGICYCTQQLSSNVFVKAANNGVLTFVLQIEYPSTINNVSLTIYRPQLDVERTCVSFQIPQFAQRLEPTYRGVAAWESPPFELTSRPTVKFMLNIIPREVPEGATPTKRARLPHCSHPHCSLYLYLDDYEDEPPYALQFTLWLENNDQERLQVHGGFGSHTRAQVS